MASSAAAKRFGQRLDKILRAHNLDQNKVAGKIGVKSPSTVTGWIQGTHFVKGPNLDGLCGLLGYDLVEFFKPVDAPVLNIPSSAHGEPLAKAEVPSDAKIVARVLAHEPVSPAELYAFIQEVLASLTVAAEGLRRAIDHQKTNQDRTPKSGPRRRDQRHDRSTTPRLKSRKAR